MANRADVEKSWMRDGTLAFNGVDGGRQASLISRDQVAFAVNRTSRNTVSSPRPGVIRRKLSFANGAMLPFQGGKFQNCFPYKGDSDDMLLSSHGGRQFQILIDSGVGRLATTNAPFTIPSQYSDVAISVDSTANLSSESDNLVVAGFQFKIRSVDSIHQITGTNMFNANVGTVVPSGSIVEIPDAWSVSEITPTKPNTVMTSAAFTIPTVGAQAGVAVTDATKMLVQQPIISIGGYTLTLTQVNSPISITVENTLSGQVGVVVANQSAVVFQVIDPNNPNNDLNWSTQAENYWILQDNRSEAIIFDGSKAVRSNEAKDQVPVGNVSCYAMGRLIVALPDRQTYRVGDLVGESTSGTAENNFRDAVLYFKDTKFLNEGGDFVARVFGAPTNAGEILSMKAGAMGDTALGQGPLIVGTPNVSFTVSLPFDRTIWKNLRNPLQTAIPINGPVSQTSTVLVNTDIWYRCLQDGIRSYITAQRQFNGSWGNTSKSNEVDDILAFDTEQYLEHCSAVYFDNRLLTTVSPQKTPNGVYWRGLAVLDFEPTTSLRGNGNAQWDGLWEFGRILQIVTGIVDKQERCFIYTLGDDNQIQLYELTKDARDDDGVPIKSRIHFCAFNCGDSDKFKRLKTARMIVTNLSGKTDFKFSWRTDDAACWNEWHSTSRCALNQDCGPFSCTGPVEYRNQARYPIRLPEPPDVTDAVSSRYLATGYEFQPMVEISGPGDITQIRVYCIGENENLGLEKQVMEVPDPVFWNTEQCASAACIGETTGSPVTKCVPANTYSDTTQAAADKKAFLDALDQAHAVLNCALAGSLAGISWQIPADGAGHCVDPPDVFATITGTPGRLYTVTLRVRGVFENKNYAGHGVAGSASGAGNLLFTCTNPTQAIPAAPGDGSDEYALIISDPPQTYFINNNPGVLFTIAAHDYQIVVQMRTGGVIGLKARTIDGIQLPNTGNISVNNAPPPIVVVEPFGGQFAQLDVVSIT